VRQNWHLRCSRHYFNIYRKQIRDSTPLLQNFVQSKNIWLTGSRSAN
jgi:hypothetical protein